jgi:hypothetical protein
MTNILLQPKSKMIQNVLIPNINIEHTDTIVNEPVVTYPVLPNEMINGLNNLFINNQLPDTNNGIAMLLLFFILGLIIHLLFSGVSIELW